MVVSKRKQRIRELEAELRLIDNYFFVRTEKGLTYHSRNNRPLLRTFEIRRELEELSLKWRLKKIYINLLTKIRNKRGGF